MNKHIYKKERNKERKTIIIIIIKGFYMRATFQERDSRRLKKNKTKQNKTKQNKKRSEIKRFMH
jgi:hypothetical protein